MLLRPNKLNFRFWTIYIILFTIHPRANQIDEDVDVGMKKIFNVSLITATMIGFSPQQKPTKAGIESNNCQSVAFSIRCLVTHKLDSLL